MSVDAQIKLAHQVLQPELKSEKPPLLLMLHGFGSNEHDLFSMAPMLNQKALVVSLRAPHSLPWGGFAWYEIDFTQLGRGRMSNIEQARESMQLLLEEIPLIQQRYGTDPEQTWLMGFSQGCILSYALALNQPRSFSRVMALSGYILKELVPVNYQIQSLKNLDFFVSHGTHDEVLPVEWARTAVEILEKLNINHQYREYPMGHGINPQCFDDLKKWLKERSMI
jgi:phospholipase/carboxylesterase